MKSTAIFLFASAVVLGFTFTAKTADFAASPRWQQVLNERKAPLSIAPSPQLVSNVYLGSTAKWDLNRPKAVPSGITMPNLVSGNYPGAAAKNPYYRPSLESSPLVKLVGKNCEMDCCAKK